MIRLPALLVGWSAVAVVVCWPVSARAADSDFLLRFATVAPDGSPWARNFRAFGQEVEFATQQRVRIKWYLGGIAGDELEQYARLERGQLDGSILGVGCERSSPAMRILRLPGLFQTRAETLEVMNQLQPRFAEQAHARGFTLSAISTMGPDLIFTRVAVHSMAELRALRLWRWDVDEVGIASSRAMGLHIVPLPVDRAAAAFERGEIDGFIAIPAAALAFRWFTQARFVIDLRPAYMFGCQLIRDASFQRLPSPYQAAIRAAIASARVRNEETAQNLEESLLGGVFQRQGVTVVPVSETFHGEFVSAARAARDQVAKRYVDAELMGLVLALLADHRAEHAQGSQ
jgi:TRAP-type C4-dicarboxylate transport system substrate-binding protein